MAKKFTLKSGNNTSFRTMGSSPIKHHEREVITPDDPETTEIDETTYGSIKKHDIEYEKYRPYEDKDTTDDKVSQAELAQQNIDRTDTSTEGKVKSAELDLETGNLPDIVKRWEFGSGGAEGVEEKYQRHRDPETGEEKMVKSKEGYPVGSKEYFMEKSKEPGYSIWSDEEFKKRLRDPDAEHFSAAEIYKQQAKSKGEFKRGEKSWRGEEAGNGYSEEQRGYNPWLRKLREHKKKDDPTTPEDESQESSWIGKTAQFLSPMSSEERRQAKLEKLQQKEETARSTGGIGISFGLLRGFTREPKSDILQRKIDRLSAKQESSKYKQDVEREWEAGGEKGPAPTRRSKRRKIAKKVGKFIKKVFTKKKK